MPLKKNAETTEVQSESIPAEPVKRPVRSVPAKDPFSSDPKPKKEGKSALASVF